jgi:hypothetical protein
LKSIFRMIDGKKNDQPSTSTTQKPINDNKFFTSNLCAVLNDPRKDRNKTNYLFIKTWGAEFTDTSSSIPALNTAHPSYPSVLKSINFNSYINQISEGHLKHLKNKAELNSQIKKNNTKPADLQSQKHDLDQIPAVIYLFY